MDNEQDISLPEGDKEYMQKILDDAALLLEWHRTTRQIAEHKVTLSRYRLINRMMRGAPAGWFWHYTIEEVFFKILDLVTTIDSLEKRLCQINYQFNQH
jgi:hypothetical protein